MSEEKQTRTVDVGFTKISDDIIVPAWRAKRGEGFSFKESSIIWWGLGGFWLFITIFTPSHLRLIGMLISALSLCLAGLFFYFIMRHPEKWIEFNRKDGFISVWTSRKKRRLIGRWHIEKVVVRMNKRCVSGSEYHSESHYLIEMVHNDPTLKSTSFWKFNNHPQKNDVPFFVLFDMFDVSRTNDKVNYERRVIASETAQKVERFIRDFMAGKPLPESSSSIYTFSTPE